MNFWIDLGPVDVLIMIPQRLACRAPAITPGVNEVGPLLHHHIARREMHFWVVEQHVKFAFQEPAQPEALEVHQISARLTS